MPRYDKAEHRARRQEARQAAHRREVRHEPAPIEEQVEDVEIIAEAEVEEAEE